MGTLIDSSLWIDYFRSTTPAAIKRQVIPFVDSPDGLLCEPVRFEILRAARRNERSRIEETFATVPLLVTPADLWRQAIQLGQQCVDARIQPRSLDLLIAIVCLHHKVEIVTFDSDFAELARACPLKVCLLSRGGNPSH